MYGSILVPLDGSEFGEQALPLAAQIAHRCGARLLLSNVFSPVGGSLYVEGYLFPNDEVDQYLHRQQVAYLKRMAARAEKLAGTQVSVHALAGGVETEIRQLARESKVDLIVLTTHGRSAMGRFWLGSVADDLLRDAPAPILLVRPQQTVDWDREPLPRHLLIPLDGSRQAEEILEPAVSLATLAKAELTLLQTIKPILPMAYQVAGGSLEQVATSLIEQIEEAHATLYRQAQAYLEKVAAPLRQQSLVVHTRVEIEEQPARAILAAAVPPIDFIAMRTHARHGLARLFLGSVTDKVLRSTHLPILVQPPHKMEK